VSLGYCGLVNLKVGAVEGGTVGAMMGALLTGFLTEPPVVKVKEEVLAPKVEPLGEGGKSVGLEMKVWLVCLKREDRFRSLVSCPAS
jgi:hypothetical protein